MSFAVRCLSGAGRVLRFFPAFLLAFVIVVAALAVRDLFFQAANQLVTVETAMGGGR